MKLRLRSRRGSAITETGPALFVLLLLIFFPLIDLLGIAANYCFCLLMPVRGFSVWTMNSPEQHLPIF